MTDAEIKEKLFKLWAEHQVKYSTLPIEHYLRAQKAANSFKNLHEIKNSMRKDGVGCEMTLNNDKRYLEAASFKYEALNGILSI